MRWFVVNASNPLACGRPPSTAHAHPPGPGFLLRTRRQCRRLDVRSPAAHAACSPRETAHSHVEPMSFNLRTPSGRRRKPASPSRASRTADGTTTVAGLARSTSRLAIHGRAERVAVAQEHRSAIETDLHRRKEVVLAVGLDEAERGSAAAIGFAQRNMTSSPIVFTTRPPYSTITSRVSDSNHATDHRDRARRAAG